MNSVSFLPRPLRAWSPADLDCCWRISCPPLYRPGQEQWRRQARLSACWTSSALGGRRGGCPPLAEMAAWWEGPTIARRSAQPAQSQSNLGIRDATLNWFVAKGKKSKGRHYWLGDRIDSIRCRTSHFEPGWFEANDEKNKRHLAWRDALDQTNTLPKLDVLPGNFLQIILATKYLV